MGKAYVAIVGCGTIGSGAAEMLTRNAARIERAAGRPIKLKYMVDIQKRTPPEGVIWTDDVDAVLRDPDVKILIEAIGGAGIAYRITQRALASGRSVVTPNKELVAVHGSELTRLAREHGVSYLYEAAVGGGIPLMRPLKTCLAGNNILGIDGIVNGTTNYILTSMDARGISFPAALGEAQAKGFAEPNPTADVEGLDPRRKVQVLAMAALGARTGEDERIPTEGVARIHPRDIQLARALRGRIKLLAHLEPCAGGWTGWVHPTILPENDAMASIQNEICAITVTGDCVGDVLLAGRGAGALPTASSIVGDVIEIARGDFGCVNCENFDREIGFVAPDQLAETYVIRVEDAPDGMDVADVGTWIDLQGIRAIQTAPVTPGALDACMKKLAESHARTGIPMKFRS